jgi:hypothetical protein
LISIGCPFFLFPAIGVLNQLARRRYYSTYGHVATLAEEIQRGAASVTGVEATLWQVPETLSGEALAKMGAPPKRAGVPAIAPAELVEADGVLFGFPTRFGMLPAQLKAFLDGTSDLWCEQRLAGKPAGIFCSTGSPANAGAQGRAARAGRGERGERRDRASGDRRRAPGEERRRGREGGQGGKNRENRRRRS